jgi:hypothetical protein
MTPASQPVSAAPDVELINERVQEFVETHASSMRSSMVRTLGKWAGALR